MNRVLAALPSGVTSRDVRALTASRWPSVIDVNEVEDNGVRHAAAYLPDNVSDVPQWRTDVAASVPLPPPVEETNTATIDARLATALAGLQTIIDTPAVTFTNLTGAQTAMRQLQSQVKDEARVLRGLIRLRLGRLDAAD